MAQLNIRKFDSDLFQALKVAAATANCTLREYVHELLRDALQSRNQLPLNTALRMSITAKDSQNRY